MRLAAIRRNPRELRYAAAAALRGCRAPALVDDLVAIRAPLNRGVLTTRRRECDWIATIDWCFHDLRTARIRKRHERDPAAIRRNRRCILAAGAVRQPARRGRALRWILAICCS